MLAEAAPGLAQPERDLSMIATAAGDEARRYAEATGRTCVAPGRADVLPDPLALDDIAAIVHQLRSRHDRTADPSTTAGPQ